MGKREREEIPGAYLQPRGPTLCSPAAAQPTIAATVFNLLPVGRRACAQRARTRRPPPPCLAAPSPPWTPPALPRNASGLLSPSPCSSSPQSLSLSHGPSATVAVDKHHRGHCLPLAPGHAQEHRPVAHTLSAESSNAGRPRTPLMSSSSTFCPPDHRRCPVVVRPSPSPL